MKARKRNRSDLDKALERVEVINNRVFLDNEMVGDYTCDGNEECHYTHYFIAVTLPWLEQHIIRRYLAGEPTFYKDDE